MPGAPGGPRGPGSPGKPASPLTPSLPFSPRNPGGPWSRLGSITDLCPDGKTRIFFYWYNLFYSTLIFFLNTELNLTSCTHTHTHTHAHTLTHLHTYTHAGDYVTKRNCTIRFAMKIDSYMFQIENK